MPSLGEARGRDGDGGGVGGDRPSRGSPHGSAPAVMDYLYRTTEHDWQAAPMRRDHRSIALHNAPVHAAILVAKEIPGRNAIELRPADISAHRIDQCIPAAERLEQARGCNVGLLVGNRVAPVMRLSMR